MTHRALLPVLALTGALAVTAAGCGSDGDSSSSTSIPDVAASTPAATSTPQTAAGGGDVKIGMKNIAFDPASVTVKVGQKITWTNEEGVPHNVKADSGASFQSDNFGEGGTYSFTPKQAGTIVTVPESASWTTLGCES